jgi:hypothetical protein
LPDGSCFVAIELFAIASLFYRGHRLRLDISSNFPHFDVNPNSGEPKGSWQRPRIARNRVFAEANRPSNILLPVIPRHEGQAAAPAGGFSHPELASRAALGLEPRERTRLPYISMGRARR